MDDFSIDQIQRNIALRLARESQMDRTIDVMSIIQSLVPDSRGRISTEAILIEAQQHGMTESQVDNTLDELARTRMITLGDGYVTF
ncbi:MAG: hypothetical protein KC535_01580 [Nanoarchaeota archaeon]|nr:hypothetical protein [Nanoarchaeota archaeon]